MRKYLIKLLGGFTEDQNSLTTKVDVQMDKRDLFRIGDLVYINNKDFNPFIQYSLLESYNNRNYWYVARDPKSTLRRCLQNGVSIDDLSFEKIKTCPCCQQKIN